MAPLCAQSTSMFDAPTASGFFKSAPGLSSETEVIEPIAPATVVTDNKDDSGGDLMEPDGIGWDFVSHTRPFADGLITYNGHAGLGGNAVRLPGKLEMPNI